MRLLATCLLGVMLLAGCAQFRVTVDSLASPDAQQHKTYLLIPGNEGVTWNDLQFREYALYVMRVLHAKGFVSADKAEGVDVAIVLFYGIGEPQVRQFSYSLPVWGQTGVSSAHTYGTATAYGNMATYSGTTTYTPSYGITGYTTHTGSTTTYSRYILLTAYDFKKFRESNEQVQLWRTTVTSTGSSGDLRRVFPVMIGAAAPYLATNTGKQVQVQLSESDDALEVVKKPVK